MRVVFQTSGWLKKYTNNKDEIELEVEEGTTVEKASYMLGIPEEEIGIMMMNGHRIQDNTILNEGDKIKIYTIIIGG